MRILVIALALAFAAPRPPPKPAAGLVPAVVQTADGLTLEASLAAPAKATRGVLLVHQNGRNRADWDALAAALARDGDLVLTFDLRGHGAQRKDPPVELTAADYQAMQGDVAAALALLKSKGATTLSVVGAELGANLVVNAAVADPAIASVVLLSPGAELKGIIAIDAVQRLGGRPLAIVAAADDMAGDRAAAVLDQKAQGAHELYRLEKGGRGAQMLMRDPSLEPWIVGWIAAHWPPPPSK